MKIDENGSNGASKCRFCCQATFGASRYAFEKLSERFCVLELDLAQMSPADVPRQRTYRCLDST